MARFVYFIVKTVLIKNYQSEPAFMKYSKSFLLELIVDESNYNYL